MVSLPAISSGSRTRPSALWVRRARISALPGTSTSPQRAMPSLVFTLTMLWVRITWVPSSSTRVTVRSSTSTAGAA